MASADRSALKSYCLIARNRLAAVQRPRRSLATLALAIAIGALGHTERASAAVSATSPAVQQAIDAVVIKYRKLYGGVTPVPGVLIGVWDAEGGSYIRAFGSADLAVNRPLTSADYFRIGSNTKTFVISVLLQLVDEGRLKLDDPLSKFSLGVTIPNAQNITVRELCEMRSGLFEAYDTPEIDGMHITPETVFDTRQLIKWAVQQKPYMKPGTGYRYSNTNYLLLGLIIENITHHSVGDEIRSRLYGWSAGIQHRRLLLSGRKNHNNCLDHAASRQAGARCCQFHFRGDCRNHDTTEQASCADDCQWRSCCTQPRRHRQLRAG
jgi:D-alanyl-D-alanine carboxypeptidase